MPAAILRDALAKSYENRSPEDHNCIVSLLAQHFPTLTIKMHKLLSFYLRLVPGPDTCALKQYTSQSYIITGLPDSQTENPQYRTQMVQITRDHKARIPEGDYGVCLDYLHYLNCIALGQTSIEEQIAFMHSSEFLCSIPRKRLYHILRHSKVHPYSISQIVYSEGQLIQSGESGSGVYLVRSGQFVYLKESELGKKHIETLRFTKGHIFGTLEIGQSSQVQDKHRKFTVKCKSHRGLVFSFSQEIYNSQIKPYCQSAISSRQSKLAKYIDSRIDTMNKTRTSQAPFLTQTLSRGFNATATSKLSQELPTLTRTRFSVPEVTTTQRFSQSQRIEEEGLRKTNYLSLAKDGPLKRYPMASQRSQFTDSQFKQFERLERNKDQCEKIRRLKMNGTGASKGQILFSFFKNTWTFDRQKKASRYSNF